MFSLFGPALPSIFSPSSAALARDLRRLPLPCPVLPVAAAAVASSSARIASRSAGMVSQRASYPRRMFARRFCSDWMWFAFFCEGVKSVVLPLGPALEEVESRDVGGVWEEEAVEARRRLRVVAEDVESSEKPRFTDG